MIDGANANRWIKIPFVGLSFQTSNLASIVLLTYVAHLISKGSPKIFKFKTSILPLWLPVFSVILLILPANLSTAALLFFDDIDFGFFRRLPFKISFRYIWGWPGTLHGNFCSNSKSLSRHVTKQIRYLDKSNRKLSFFLMEMKVIIK